MKSAKVSAVYSLQQFITIALQFSVISILGLSASYDKYIVASTIYIIIAPILEAILVPLVATSSLGLRILFSSILWLGLAVGIVNFIFGGILLAKFFPGVLNPKDSSYVLLNTWFSLAVFLSFIVSFYKGYLISIGEQIRLSWLGLLGALLQFSFVLIFLSKLGIQGLVIGIVLVNIIYIVNMVFTIGFDFSYFKPVIERHLLTSFGRLILSGFSSKLNVVVDRVFLSRMPVGLLSTAFVGEKVVRIAADGLGKGLNWTSLDSKDVSFSVLSVRLRSATMIGLTVWALFVSALFGVSLYLSLEQVFVEYLVAIRFALLMSPLIVFGLLNTVLTNFFYVRSKTKQLAFLNVIMQLVNVLIRIGIIVILDFEGVAIGYWMISMFTSASLLLGLNYRLSEKSAVPRKYVVIVALMGLMFLICTGIFLEAKPL